MKFSSYEMYAAVSRKLVGHDCVESCGKVEQGDLLAGQTPNNITRSQKFIK